MKIIAKILLLPVVAALMLIQWAGIFLNSISGVHLGILAIIFTLTGIASLAFGLASGTEALEMMVIGVVIFMVPVVGEWLLNKIIATNFRLREFFKS